jgi:hypothetical protein
MKIIEEYNLKAELEVISELLIYLSRSTNIEEMKNLYKSNVDNILNQIQEHLADFKI